jgi:putative ABC transport system permease protein
VWNVTTLIAGEFALLVLVANAIAWPLAYLTGQRWLEQFAYRTEWSWAVVAAAGSISLILAMATISVHTLRTAFRNPVEILRYE